VRVITRHGRVRRRAPGEHRAKLLNKIQNALVTIEPAWLASKRKAYVGPATTFLVDELAKRGVHLTQLEAAAAGLIVGAIVTWAIPNRPAASTPPAT